MVGGKNFSKVKLNAATQAHRQAGSSFKPFTLTAAMEQKISPKSVWNGPSQIDIPDPICKTNGKDWTPHNYADESGGTMTLLDATAHSVNTIFAQLVVTVGPESVVDVANRMGIQSELQPVCSITLGTQEVTPLEMADAFSTLAARGVHHDAISVRQVRSAQGRSLFKAQIQGDQVLRTNDADLVTLALQGVVTHGTGVAANLSGRPAAGKTGTTQDFTDAWFCGYVPQLTTCVWVGYTKGRVPMHDIEGYANVVGGTLPAVIWHDFMSQATANLPVKGFATPSFAGYNLHPKGAQSPTPSPSPSPTPSKSPEPSPLPTTPSPLPTSPSPSPSPSPSANLSPTGSANPP
jgi:penicillin-binding protein 1A